MTMPTKPADGASWSSWGAFIDTFVRSATNVGKALLSATDGASARSAIGAGTASTKSDVGLGNVNNTADVDKPVSSAQGTALAPKSALAAVVFHDGTTGGGTRPTGYARVVWVNPPGTTYARPQNMLDVDIHELD
jgi:hypothetical protein